MTDLEYMICEAERCGEIDLDTRDEMLNIITEADKVKVASSTVTGGSVVYITYLKKKIKDNKEKIKMTDKRISQLRDISYISSNKSDKKKIEHKIHLLVNQKKILNDEIDKYIKKCKAVTAIGLGSTAVLVGNNIIKKAERKNQMDHENKLQKEKYDREDRELREKIKNHKKRMKTDPEYRRQYEMEKEQKRQESLRKKENLKREQEARNKEMDKKRKANHDRWKNDPTYRKTCIENLTKELKEK